MRGPATVQQRPSYPNAPTNVYYWECRECGHEGGWVEGGSVGDLRAVEALAEEHNREIHGDGDPVYEGDPVHGAACVVFDLSDDPEEGADDE